MINVLKPFPLLYGKELSHDAKIISELSHTGSKIHWYCHEERCCVLDVCTPFPFMHGKQYSLTVMS